MDTILDGEHKMDGCIRIVCGILVILLGTISLLSHVKADGCTTYINSTNAGTAQSGNFSSPRWPSDYPVKSHCSIIFIGREDQRVRIKFNFFQIQGISPLCQFDYVDIYAQVSTANPDVRLYTPLLGRFCGDRLSSLPRLIISTKNIIIIDLHSDYRKTDKGFHGTYSFIDASIYNIGSKLSGTPCSFTIYSSTQPSGYIISPTYPGVYPDHLSCSYLLRGQKGERIKINFVVFALFHGGDYCPYDAVTVYDGENNKAAVIGRFCGYHNTTSFYSSGHNLYIEFNTSAGRTGFNDDIFDRNVDFKFDRRGFNISYEFSASFISRPFVNQVVHHIKGTACDRRIPSASGSNGTIKSPGYPNQFPSNVTCHIYLDGLSNNHVLERVKVSFKDFNIPGSMPQCDHGFLSVNYRGDKDSLVRNERFCGSLLPPDLFSQGPRMVIIFNTDNAKLGRGFVATYKFIPDYGVPGEQVEEGSCKYLYNSKMVKSGSFNTPRFPNSYPDFVSCTYIFRPLEGEYLLISFDLFSLGKTKDVKICNNADYIEISEKDSYSHYVKKSRHCGDWFPGPILSRKEVKIVFRPNKNKNNTGFDARFEFLTYNKLNTNCGPTFISSTGKGGLIKSPDYPEKYKSYAYCNWTIEASKSYNKILIHTISFHTEGLLSKDGVIEKDKFYGCQNAVLRVYASPHAPPEEKCGHLYDEVAMSEGNRLHIEFLTSSRALGAQGFKMTWTELHKDESTCSRFRCKLTDYCIDNELTCNGLPNCGKELESDKVDKSDEKQHEGCPATGEFQILHIAIGASISSFFCIVLVICGLYHKRRSGPPLQRRAAQQLQQDQVEVRYVAASSSCNTTDRLLQIDHTGENGHKESKFSTPMTSPNDTPKLKKYLDEKGANMPNSNMPNQTQVNSISMVNRINSNPRTPRIQKVSIV